MLNDSDQTVNCDCRADLYSHSVFCSAPKLLNLKVLFEPFEEQLYLPAVLLEVGNLYSRKMEGIGKEREFPVLLLIVESDQPKSLRILLI